MNSVRSGSTSSNSRSSGRPPTLWWDLMLDGAGAAAGLDHVGVERALHQELRPSRPSAAASPSTSASAASKTRMNSRPMILRFSSGSLTPASASRKRFCGVDDVQVDAGGGDEVALDLLGLALAQQAVVDEDAGQPVADRPLDEGRGDRGVDAAGEAADGAAVSPIWSRIRSICSSTMLTIVQVGRQPAISCRKCSSTSWPCSVCITSGCHCTPARPRSTSSNAATGVAVGRGEDREAVRRRDHRVAVGHPDPVLRGKLGEQRARLATR